MFEEMPRTPFSTHLSGSARETELRIRSIMSGPKRRPPIPFLILVFSLCVFCGNIVSCQQQPAQPTIIMETQYYDNHHNYLELPMLSLPAGEKNEAVEAINAGLTQLGKQYDFTETDPGMARRCVLYPSTTNRYISLVFFETSSDHSDNDGYGTVYSWVYDKKEGVQVTEEDALALAETTREALFSDLEEAIANDPEDPRGLYPDTPDPIALMGFRIKADGKPVFYLSAYLDSRVLENGGYYTEWRCPYVWDEGEFSPYACMFSPDFEQYPLVPAEETDQLDPPLWNQWYFSGEEPVGGFIDKSLMEPAYTYVPGEDPFGGNFYGVLMEQYAQYVGGWNVFYAESQQDTDKAGDLRVTATAYLGEIPWNEDTNAAAYQVCYTFYIDGPQGLEWYANFEDIVLSRSIQTGEFTGLLGRMDYEDRMLEMTAEEIIREATEG